MADSKLGSHKLQVESAILCVDRKYGRVQETTECCVKKHGANTERAPNGQNQNNLGNKIGNSSNWLHSHSK